ncbi:MAG: hypothetical protein HDQ88_07325 [Clostridia bacterium]|nr:hypothetical protein [Clostridia bacterium]
MTAAILTIMDNIFSVSFFWKGEKRCVESSCDHWPVNDTDAYGLAFLAIKSCVENQELGKTEIVRNVDLVANQKSYHWDAIPL